MKKRQIIQVVGHKNAGKTTLICQLIEAWIARGFVSWVPGVQWGDTPVFSMEEVGQSLGQIMDLFV